jgi:hypothetical protein
LPPAPRATLVLGLKGTIVRIGLGLSVRRQFYALARVQQVSLIGFRGRPA